MPSLLHVLSLFISLIVLISTAKAQSQDDCSPLPNDVAELVDTNDGILLVGELHGTTESPGRFLDLICHASKKSSSKTIVAIEYLPGQIQLTGDNQQLKQSVEQLDSWQQQHDGKTSEAMFFLLTLLNQLVAEHRIEVAFFDASTNDRELAMAQNLMALKRPNTQVIALTGNRHNKIQHGNDWDPDSKNMGAYMREYGANVTSLNLLHGGGSAWVCMEQCKSHNFPPPKIPHTKILFEASAANGYQYHWAIGPISASKPYIATPQL
ncbi:TraB/GumN family protein [Shewanella sedimentimangrovi]|uniref:Erythromycin esterase family protein n=1 Tax=Shewanella sedimentimangrovi TaxID=2814293 RepID=A0ABX7R305_9GAMM|nr:erythromycin esterase family protein [Shewanella sedimentimangrovi]QSX37541.1 erythromycin esterase family protein [Shewanella sedimentimangrovi]